jgi:hypothetical protein
MAVQLRTALREALLRFEKLLTDNSPTVLTGVGVAGVITTAYFAGRASFKAAEIILMEETNNGTRFPPKERLRMVWTLYLPAVGSAILTVSTIIFANRIGTRRAAAMAAAYSLTEKAFTEYREKIVEKLGEKKEREARDELAQDRLAKNPLSSREVIVTGGAVLCYEVLTGRYFTSDIETLRKAQNDINHVILQHGYASLTDFYHRIGLASTAISEDIGWNSNKLLDLEISTVLSEDNRPCLSISYAVEPGRNYYK